MLKSLKPKFDSEGNVINKDAMIAREEKRLLELFKDLPEDKLIVAVPIMKSIAFMTVAMIELEAILKIKGFVEEYCNGQSQFGLKESSESKAYISLSKVCLSYRKQLLDVLKASGSKLEADELMSFLAGK